MEMLHQTVRQLTDAMAEGEFSARELVFACLDRIEAVDTGPAGHNAVLTVNPEALQIADARDAERRAGRIRGPLHGIPVLVKDNICTADPMPTTAGSYAMRHHYAAEDAELVRRLRAAGAILLGKTNMTEWANYMADGMKNGYSSMGGQVICACGPKADAGGSSTGSAAAAALSLAPLTVGTETCGSIMSPAQKNGVVGIKPTTGRISRRGIIPISTTLDTAGPMAKCLEDAALLLEMLSGYDPQDAATGVLRGRPVPPFGAIEGETLRGRRIGLNSFGRDQLREEDRQALDVLLDCLTGAGAEILPIPELAGWDAVNDVMRYEFKACLNASLASLGDRSPIHSLEALIDYNNRHADRMLRYGQARLLFCQNQTSGRMQEPAYLQALREREAAIRTLDRTMEEGRLDLILCASYNQIAPFTGHPSVTLPLGLRRDGSAIGSYFIGRRWGEYPMLRLLRAVERAMAEAGFPQISTCLS